MAAIALAFALETAVLAYLLVEFGDDNGGELEIPASVNMAELIEAANEIDVLNAPINIPSLVGGDDEDNSPPKHVAKDVIDKIRRFRNLIHPARALKDAYDPRSFTRAHSRTVGRPADCPRRWRAVGRPHHQEALPKAVMTGAIGNWQMPQPHRMPCQDRRRRPVIAMPRRMLRMDGE